MNKKVKKFLKSFDNIFTLNYDRNIEELTGREVFHLHGDYFSLVDSENPTIIEGYIRQQAGEPSIVIEDFRHCFCNALLLDYSGKLKLKRALDIIKCTSEMNRWLELLRRDEDEFKKQIAALKEKDKKVYQYVITYVHNPTLKVGTDYYFDKFSNLEGELHIIGLSPNNDSHIFKCINESKLEKVYFYYYSEKDKNISINKPYKLLSVLEL